MGRKSDAKEKLMNAAMLRFASQGTLSISVDHLCRDAGVNKGSFYHFFPSKNDILIAALEQTWLQNRTRLLEPAFSPDLPPLERVERFFELVYQMQCEVLASEGFLPGCSFCNIGLEQSGIDPEMRCHIKDYTDRHRAYIRSALTEACENGSFSGNPAAMADAVYNFMCGSLLQSRLANDPEILRRDIPAMVQLLRSTPVSSPVD